MYLLAFVCPPLAILLCGKPFQALLSIPLLCMYFPSALWALLVVSDHKANRRTDRLIRAADRNAKELLRSAERNAAEVARAVRQQQPRPQVIIQQQPPASIPADQAFVREQPKPSPASPAGELPPPAPSPRFTLDDLRVMVARGRDAAIAAYRDLPEWAQPVAWGLAAGTPVAMALALFWMVRR